MRTTNIFILSAAILLTATSCRMSPVEWITFDDERYGGTDSGDYSSLDSSTCFIPYASSASELDSDALLSCPAPGGEKVGDIIECGETKTTSTNGSGLFTSLISMWNSGKIRSYSGSYMSTDLDGSPIRLSGRIILPADGKVSRIMIATHFTITSNNEAPSNSVTMESMFAAKGLAVIEPDYIGYGVTSDRIHPYLCTAITAKNVIDMYFASLPFLKHIGCMPQYDDVFILGYSQGGAVAMSVASELEVHYPQVKIRLAMCGAGPYDICATYDTMIDNDYTDIPCAIPLIIQGMNEGMKLGLDYGKFFVPHITENLDKWINSKEYRVSQITEMIGSNNISDMLTPAARDKVKDLMTDLYRAMVDNSVTNDWLPTCPVYLFHSINDNVVPFINSENVSARMIGYNVIYNFGYYGSHTMGCLRFMYSCIDLLRSNGDI